jgi:hypothetical protein
MRTPSKQQVEAAKREIAREDKVASERRLSPEDQAQVDENHRRSNLPSEHPEHICGWMCDGQDGSNSYCARLRYKLFGGGAK